MSFMRSSKISERLLEEAGQVGSLIVEATSEFRGRASWDINLKIVDLTKETAGKAQRLGGSAMHRLESSVKILWKRLMSKEIKTVLLTLELVDALVKNCGTGLHSALMGDKDFLSLLKFHCTKLMNTKGMIGVEGPGHVQRKALSLTQSWARAFQRAGRDSQYRAGKKLIELYKKLKSKGADFPIESIDEKKGPKIFMTEENGRLPSSSTTTDSGRTAASARKRAEVKCMGGCGFVLPTTHPTGFCSTCTQMREKSEIPCKGGCSFMLASDHATGYCSLCAKRLGIPAAQANKKKRTSSSVRKKTAAGTPDVGKDSEEQKEREAEDVDSDLDLFSEITAAVDASSATANVLREASNENDDFFGDIATAAPSSSSKGSKVTCETDKVENENDLDLFLLPPPPSSRAKSTRVAKPKMTKKEKGGTHTASNSDCAVADAIGDLDLDDLFS